jgi:hypothetical protein
VLLLFEVSLVLTAEVPLEVPLSALAVLLPEVLLELESEFESESESEDEASCVLELLAGAGVELVELDESVLELLVLAFMLVLDPEVVDDEAVKASLFKVKHARLILTAFSAVSQ